MNIEFIGKYKSITDFHWKDVPMFAVITGMNGTGKSQLIDLILHSINNNVHFLGGGKALIDEDIQRTEVVHNSSDWQIGSGEGADATSHNTRIESWYNTFTSPQNRDQNRGLEHIFSQIEEKLSKTWESISFIEFSEACPIISNPSQHTFVSELSALFQNIWARYLEAKNKGGEEYENFKQSTPYFPWEVLNDMMRETSLPFVFKEPVLFDKYMLKILANDSNEEILLNDLSSGEKVIITLALYLFNSENLGVFPKLMLLDEPDAHLHPSLTKQFLDAILNVLVKKYGVRVIMSTHSPSTVALCPEEYLFEMTRTGERIKPVKSKNRLISMLTSGLITVRPGTKYVMVEDEDDKNFYSMLFDYMSANSIVNSEVPLVFIPASVRDTTNSKVTVSSSGGKGPVRSWVEKLHDSGLEDIFQGIIDRDVANPESNGVHVLGRYSFENYLLDPLVVYAALLGTDKQPAIDGITLNFGEEYKIGQLQPAQLQQIADTIHSQIEPKISMGGVQYFKEEDKQKIDIELTNGQKLQYPKWLINCRGHDLMNAYSSHFTSKLIRQDLLLNAMRRIWFVSIDVKDLFEAIQFVQEPKPQPAIPGVNS